MGEPLRILMVSHNPLRRELGASKVLIELGEELSPLGWRVDYLQPSDLGVDHTSTIENQQVFTNRLGEHLVDRCKEFDVVDFDHEYLPFARDRYCSRTLMVARSVLLIHHFDVIPIPSPRGILEGLKTLIRARTRRARVLRRLESASRTLESADLVNVSNRHDREELIRRGVSPDKIIVLPFGISAARRPSFDAISLAVPQQPRVVFVGTFDYRKGAREFSTLLRAIRAQVPHVQFKFLGTKGLFVDEISVRARLPAEMQDRIEVVPQFAADDLPRSLEGCSAGVFPSRIEGFPFGVLEMLASGLPVIAYDSPGPPEMLPVDWLVPRGNVSNMAESVIRLLTDDRLLGSARALARESSRRFTWARVAADTDRVYRTALADHRRAHP